MIGPRHGRRLHLRAARVREREVLGSLERRALGYGNTNYVGYTEAPAQVDPVSLGGPVVDIGSGWGHTCALLENAPKVHG